MTMREWRTRPRDVAILFNPAFCAALINRVAKGYQGTTDQGFPYALAFIALPLILHPNSSSHLPASAKSRMHTWLLNTPEVVFGFDERARSIAPFARESIAFGTQNKILSFVEGGQLLSVDSSSIKKWEKKAENALLCKQAQVLGKLLAQVKDVPTVFSLFGVRP